VTYLKAGDGEVHANGGRDTLHIRHVDELGRVSGSVFGQPITGWWSERARRLVFSQNGEEADPSDGAALVERPMAPSVEHRVDGGVPARL
jgi:hypothetical protein